MLHIHFHNFVKMNAETLHFVRNTIQFVLILMEVLNAAALKDFRELVKSVKISMNVNAQIGHLVLKMPSSAGEDAEKF